MRPFRVDVPDADLRDLQDRLARTRWPDEADGAGWDLGIPLAEVRALVERWRTGFDWRAHEARLNAVPGFLAEVDGAQVHVLHQPSPEPGALPLLLTHGWPGSVAEFLDLVGPLSDPRAHGGDPADAFHVVVPALPGYGFSGPARERGWGPSRIARAWAQLMDELGYARFGAQGGDWGGIVTAQLKGLAPDRVVGAHVNFLVQQPREDDALTDEDRRRLAHGARFVKDGSGYRFQQGTRPQTLAYALHDSPVGQLAWIAEKFAAWSDAPLDPDVVLFHASLYWLTGTAGSSARLYAEQLRDPAPPRSDVPTGVAVFPEELVLPIRRWAEADHRITHWSEFDRGGHFAALEQPQLLLEDVRAFFRPLR